MDEGLAILADLEDEDDEAVDPLALSLNMGNNISEEMLEACETLQVSGVFIQIVGAFTHNGDVSLGWWVGVFWCSGVVLVVVLWWSCGLAVLWSCGLVLVVVVVVLWSCGLVVCVVCCVLCVVCCVLCVVCCDNPLILC